MTLLYGDPDLFGQRPVTGAEVSGITVRPISKRVADDVIRSGHYSHTVVWSSSIHLGVYAEDRLLGALQLGPAMNPASGHKIVAGSTPKTWLELNRLYLSDDKPENTATRALACTWRYLRQARPEVEWVQSFADERCGKLGGVYQAASMTYCGAHQSTFYEVDGITFHKSMLDRPDVDKRGWRPGPRVAWAKANAHRATPVSYQQFRYIKFLTRGARRRLLLPSLPYPKPMAAHMSYGEV